MHSKHLYKGIFYTSLASLFWGIPQPIFFNEIKFIPALEIVSHRSLWSFLFLLIIVLLFNKITEFINIFKSKKKLLFLSFSAILISFNWTGFIMAVNFSRVQDASMGYYISPMISIGLGYLFLKENISYLKSISLFLMLISIIFLLISSKTIPILALYIGSTWAVYGLIRKKVNISAEIGLLYESGFISIIAFLYLLFLHLSGKGYFLNDSPITSVFLCLTGMVTIFPLFFFNLGVKSLPLGLTGVIFYLTPTFHFITSVFILNEDINIFKIISFIIIWLAVIIFIFDQLKEKKISENNTQLLN